MFDLDTAGMEESQDRLGGGSYVKNSKIYDGQIKYAYLGESQKGARFVQLEVTLEDGSDYRETIYFTSNKEKGQKPYSEKNGKKTPLPGFSLVDSISLITVGKGLKDVLPLVEEKTIKAYDFDLKAEAPKVVQMLMPLIGGKVKLGIVKKVEWKRKEINGEWKDTDEVKEFNNIQTVFHPTALVTVSEARAGKKSAEEAEFYKQWNEKFEGQVVDERKGNPAANSGNAGRPTPSGSAPQAGGSTAGKGLFD